MDLTTHTPKGVDKTHRYGWVTKDEPGVLKMLHKDVLRIHPAYQRELLTEKVKALTAAWSWLSLGTLVVGERGGEFWVIDGQHRLMAAKRRSDITHLPCMVFKTVDVQTEARGFLDLNTNRKFVTAIAKHKAMVAAEDRTAIFVREQCTAAGLELAPFARKVGQIKAVAWCMRRAAEAPDTFTAVLNVAAELSKQDDVAVHERVLEGLWWLHTKCGAGFADERLMKRLRAKGARALETAANRAAAYYAAGGGRVWAEGMLIELNKGLVNKFKLNLTGEDE
jgi:hypothetical protein